MESLKIANQGPNNAFVVWSTCLLWLTSMFAITWSLLLFFCVGDMLILTGTDLVNAFVLLSGVVMLPTTLHMMCSIAQNRKINHKTKVACCPLWLCILWIILVNLTGAILCVQRMRTCKSLIDNQLSESIKGYRISAKNKHFIDNLQWSLKCCGQNDYTDWFTRDWYDKTRDYEWEPRSRRHNSKRIVSKQITDSVPLSCCKSGSCISNYLSELGTYSIYTNGCSSLMYRIVMISMSVHLFVFVAVICIEVLILKFITKKQSGNEGQRCKNPEEYNVRHIMNVKRNFHASSESYVIPPDDSDESIRHYQDD